VTWLPFDLHPEYPPEGIQRAQLHARYGERFHDHVREMFAAAGLECAPPPAVVPNSNDALRITELARDRGLHEPLHDRLMDAYWARSQNIGDHEVLREVAVEAGLDGEEVDDLLAGDAYAGRIAASTAQAGGIGATGVPAWVLDGRLLVLGAQPREVFDAAFARLGIVPLERQRMKSAGSRPD
jgi:predicted DsbA family dithiol-disulfide isomerase